MPGIKQDASNSRREWQVGGGGYDNASSTILKSDTILVGMSVTYSSFVYGHESGFGYFGVGKDPSARGRKWYSTILADSVVERGTKFNFFTSIPHQSVRNPNAPPLTFSAVLTNTGDFLRTQYIDTHLVTSKVSSTGPSGVSTTTFTELSSSGELYIQNGNAEVLRLLATINGLRRSSSSGSVAFSAYWDVTFGLKNFLNLPSSGTFDFIGGSYLNQVSRSSYISTGTSPLTSAPRLKIETSNSGYFNIKVEIDGEFSMIGSAKLTSVECGDLYTTYTRPSGEAPATTTTTSTTTAPPEGKGG